MSQLKLFNQASQKNPRAKSIQKEMDDLEALSLVRLSPNYIFRDLMYSTECAALGLSNYPENPEMAIRAGKALCAKILEPIREKFGGLAITFAYQCRAGVEAKWSAKKRAENPRSSQPHQFDRGTFGDEIYARVDILVFAVEDGKVSKEDFARWCMMNLDIDLFMQWSRASICCISISPMPRRVWFRWNLPEHNEPRRTFFMGTDFWQREYFLLPENERPKYGPSCTGGCVQWHRKK